MGLPTYNAGTEASNSAILRIFFIILRKITKLLASVPASYVRTKVLFIFYLYFLKIKITYNIECDD